MYEKLASKLNELKIPFDIVEHPPAHTTEEADAFIEGYEGVRTKSMFLTNKKKTAFYLLIMDDGKRLDFEEFREIAGAKRLKMASAESSVEKLNLVPGVISMFGLLDNPEKDIKVYFDKEILAEPILTFHPNVNTKTIFVKTEDILRFMDLLDYPYEIIELSPSPIDY